MIFDSKISVPVTKDNDVASLIPFVKRSDVNLVPDVKMVQPLQMREPGQSVTRYTESHTEDAAEEMPTSSEFSKQSADKFEDSDQNGASKPGDETSTPAQVSEQTA